MFAWYLIFCVQISNANICTDPVEMPRGQAQCHRIARDMIRAAGRNRTTYRCLYLQEDLD